MKRRYLTTVCCLITLAATPALAHETWLLPSVFASPPGKPIAFDLTSGMGFPESEHPVASLRVVVARARCGRHQADIKDVADGERALRMVHTFPEPGLAAIWVSLGERNIDLTDDQVEEYFAEIGATDKLRAEWSAFKGKEPWSETYFKYAKTFVAVGDAARGDRSWSKPVGLAMELIPMTSPLELRAGGEATFEIRMKGKPIAGVPVGILAEGSTRRFATTDKEGRVTFKLEKPGRTLIHATHLRRDPDGPGWRSDFSTLTLNVGAP